jgi:hypothetical protein
MSGRISPESGYMPGFIVLISAAILISLAMFALLINPSYFTGKSAYSSFNALTDDLALSGHVTGYADTAITGNGNIPSSPQMRPGLTMARLNLRLASLRLNWEPGAGDDLSKATVVIITPDGSEKLPRRAAPPFVRPGWTITREGGVLPGTNADADEILEPNEEFTIAVSPSENLQPGTPFSLVISMPNVHPFTLNRTVPRVLSPVMVLG